MSDQTTLSGGAVTRVGHCKKDSHTVYIGRGDRGGSHMMNTEIGERGWLGNPFPKDKHGRQQCVEMFRSEFEYRLENDDHFRTAVANLQGEILGCWCQRINEDGPLCHGEVIAEWVERLNPQTANAGEAVE